MTLRTYFLIAWLQLSILNQAVWVRTDGGLLATPTYLFRMIYFLFLYAVGIFFAGRKATVFFSIYAWFRVIDDRVDGDRKDLPFGIDVEVYLAEMRQVLNARRFAFPEDTLMRHVFHFTDGTGTDVSEDLQTILSLIELDSRRKLGLVKLTSQDFQDYAVRQDTAILRIAVKINGGDQAKFGEILPVVAGVFTRIDWLKDLPSDLDKGLLNVPQEKLHQHNVPLEHFLTCRSWEELRIVPNFSTYYAHEVRELIEQWKLVDKVLGRTFAGVFPSRIVTWLVDRGLVRVFESELQACVLRSG